MPLLTVGIPVFNAMPYLPESVESILGQSFRDFEILVINDGSTDGSWDYLQSIRDCRLRLIDQENRGLSSTLNRMLAEARTPWLARHDADDVAYSNRLARTAEFIRQYPDAGMFYSLADYHPKGSVGQFRSTKGTPEEIRNLVRSGYLPAICHPTVTLHVARAIRAGGYRFNLHVEDIDLWWRLALAEEIRFIPESLVGFRQNLASISSANLESQAINTLYIQYLLVSHLREVAPLPYGEACVGLRRLFDARQLKFKTHIRAFNIALGRKTYFNALGELVRAWFASPANFSRRVLDEFARQRTIALGESSEAFVKEKEFLWPAKQSLQTNPRTDVEVFSEVS